MIVSDIKKIIEEIEKYPCVPLGVDRVKELTGKTYNYINDEFKKITGNTIDSYRLDRQISIIIEKMYEENIKLSEVDLSPWSNVASFTKAFKSRFNKPPMRFIKEYNKDNLYPKLDIDQYYNEYKEDIAIKKSLIRKYKSEIEAAKYILSLKPYRIDHIQAIFTGGVDDYIHYMIENKYADIVLGIANVSTDPMVNMLFKPKIIIPKEFYKEEESLINKYYDLEKTINIKYHEHPIVEKTSFSGHEIASRVNKYIGIRESLRNITLENINMEDIINKNIDPKNLTTLWEIRKAYSKQEDFYITQDIFDIKLSINELNVIRYLMMQEQGVQIFNSLIELKEYIKYDFEKIIKPKKEIIIPACEECKHIKKFSKEDQEIFLAEDKYEALTIDRLCSIIIDLMLKGYIYLKK